MADMKNAEEAYKFMASILLGWANEKWLALRFHTTVYKTMCGGIDFTEIDEQGEERTPSFDWDGIDGINKATLFLRDHLLATTGNRIWGLTFTLYPDGKFKIEYDYNKPEDYEETDETISLDEALLNLSIQRDQ
jgi:hypothetical protein